MVAVLTTLPVPPITLGATALKSSTVHLHDRAISQNPPTNPPHPKGCCRLAAIVNAYPITFLYIIPYPHYQNSWANQSTPAAQTLEQEATVRLGPGRPATVGGTHEGWGQLWAQSSFHTITITERHAGIQP